MQTVLTTLPLHVRVTVHQHYTQTLNNRDKSIALHLPLPWTEPALLAITLANWQHLYLLWLLPNAFTVGSVYPSAEAIKRHKHITCLLEVAWNGLSAHLRLDLCYRGHLSSLYLVLWLNQLHCAQITNWQMLSHDKSTNYVNHCCIG